MTQNKQLSYIHSEGANLFGMEMNLSLEAENGQRTQD
jgi:hypothetical protein